MTRGYWIALVIAVAALLIGLFAGQREAGAHESPKGWKYPSDCCSSDGRECHRVERSEIAIGSVGYSYKGYMFAYGHPNIKQSGDGDWHVCERVAAEEGGSRVERSVYCIIVPEGGQS